MMKPKEKKTCIIARNINKSDIYSIKKVKETNWDIYNKYTSKQFSTFQYS